MSPAQHERAAVCNLLDELGPDAPVLPEGWRTAEMAAHLWVRERRLDAGPGMVLGGAAKRHTDNVMSKALRDRGYERLVADVRDGPPLLSVFSLPGVGESGNVAEYFVHTEDVRRAQPTGGPARTLPDDLEEALWRAAVRSAPILLWRQAKGVGVKLERPTGQAAGVRGGTPTVTLRGEPGELVLWLFGRRDAADVELLGPPEVVARLES